MKKLIIKGEDLDYATLFNICENEMQISLDESCKSRINDAAKVVAKVISDGKTVYGINTGFGLLANTRINPDELERLQHSIVLSHAAGVGEYLSDSSVRLLMVLKINSLARGYSGVRLAVIDALIALLNEKIYPCIPIRGSVGASGDLAPLAHMSAVLLGEGYAHYFGEKIEAKQALDKAGLSQLTLAPKEGLALLNGTQVSTALALKGLFAAENCINTGIVTGALSIEAARGSHTPFDDRILNVQNHQAARDVASCFRNILKGSEIRDSHRNCKRVQDPYSLRCQPQVMGACLQQIRNSADIILTEVNGVSDNPLVFVTDDAILSGGNFHAEFIAMAADNLAIALAEIGALAERRIALLIDSKISELPPFLVDNGGVNSGFMMAQVTAAALASENKSLSHPASVDSLPTSANQEDHVSMATFAARRLQDIASNTINILAIEYLAACQGIDFLAPLKTSTFLEKIKSILRQHVGFYDVDRYFSPDIEKANQIIMNRELSQCLNIKIFT